MNKVGNAPHVKGVYGLKCPEFQYVQYMPMAMHGSASVRSRGAVDNRIAALIHTASCFK
jgi:hypothetical protein